MAEVFGIVGGAAGLAVQIFDAYKKIKDLLEGVKDAPKYVEETVRWTRILKETLEVTINYYRNTDPRQVPDTVVEAIILCTEVNGDLWTLADNLDASLKQKPSKNPITLTKFKVSRYKDEIIRLKGRALEAVQLLQLANTSFSLPQLSEILAQVKIIANNGSNNASQAAITNSQSPQTNTESSQIGPLNIGNRHLPEKHLVIRGGSTVTLWTPLGVFRIRYASNEPVTEIRTSDSKKISNSTKPPWSLHFIPASWLSRNSYLLSKDWKYTLTPYTPRDETHPIFCACIHGPLDTVRDLIDGGFASPYDVTESGHTLLHLAAGGSQPEICEFLIERGADANYGLPKGWTPLLFLGAITAFDNRHATMDTVRVLVEKGHCDVSDEVSLGSKGTVSIFEFWSGQPEPYKWLLEQDCGKIDLQTMMRPRGDNHLLHRVIREGRPGAQIAFNILREIEDISDLAQLRDKNNRTLLDDVMLGIHCLCMFYDEKRAENPLLRAVLDKEELDNLESYGDLAVRLLQSGTPLHAEGSGGAGRSILSNILCWDTRGRSQYNLDDPREIKAHTERLINLWFVFVQEAGYELSEYIYEERRLRSPLDFFVAVVHSVDDKKTVFHARINFVCRTALPAPGQLVIRMVWRKFHAYSEDQLESVWYGPGKRKMPGSWD